METLHGDLQAMSHSSRLREELFEEETRRTVRGNAEDGKRETQRTVRGNAEDGKRETQRKVRGKRRGR